MATIKEYESTKVKGEKVFLTADDEARFEQLGKLENLTFVKEIEVEDVDVEKKVSGGKVGKAVATPATTSTPA